MTILASRAQLRASLVRWALFLIPVVLLLGLLSGKLSGSGAENPWFAALLKPELYPPPQAFPITWTILYVLMGLAAAMIAVAWGANGRRVALMLFAVQLALNLAWSPLFFGMHQIRWALVLLVALDLAALTTAAAFWRVRRTAGVLLLPYLLWLAFATYLNWQVLELNPSADGGEHSGAVQRFEL